MEVVWQYSQQVPTLEAPTWNSLWQPHLKIGFDGTPGPDDPDGHFKLKCCGIPCVCVCVCVWLTAIFIISLLVAQESKSLLSWVFWFWSLTRLPSRCQLNQHCLKTTSKRVLPGSLLYGGFSSLHTIGQTSPFTPHYVGIFLEDSHRATRFMRLSKWEDKREQDGNHNLLQLSIGNNIS